MASEKVKVVNGGAGFWSLLGLLFIGLKLGGVINWSWWLVTLPLWGGLAVLAVFLLIGGIIYAIAKAAGA